MKIPKKKKITIPRVKRFRARKFESAEGQYRISPKDWNTIEICEYGRYWTDSGSKLNEKLPE